MVNSSHPSPAKTPAAAAPSSPGSLAPAAQLPLGQRTTLSGHIASAPDRQHLLITSAPSSAEAGGQSLQNKTGSFFSLAGGLFHQYLLFSSKKDANKPLISNDKGTAVSLMLAGRWGVTLDS